MNTHRLSYFLSPFFLLFCYMGLYLPLPTASADSFTMSGVVSERSAPDAAAGAERVLENRDNVQIRLRTPEQIKEMSDQKLQTFLAESNVLFAAAVFGPQIPRLIDVIERHYPEDRPFIAVSSDMRLNRMSRIDGERILQDIDPDTYEYLTENPDPETDPLAHTQKRIREHPALEHWLTIRLFWQSRGEKNMQGLYRYLYFLGGQINRDPVPDPQPQAPIRFYSKGTTHQPDNVTLSGSEPIVPILDLDSGDRAGNRNIHDRLHANLADAGFLPISVFARWGSSGRKALRMLHDRWGPEQITAAIMLQDFTIGGGSGQERAIDELKSLNVPVLKGIRLINTPVATWKYGHQGVPPDEVHYRIAMPELQGVSQPVVVAGRGQPDRHQPTGVRLITPDVIPSEIDHMTERIRRIRHLQKTPPEDRKVAIIYYNHPPGRHNIGADSLNIEKSLHRILQMLEREGYDMTSYPDTPDQLLDQIQKRGLNLPEQPEALRKMADQVPGLSGERYKKWFRTLPETVRSEMKHGVLGYVHQLTSKLKKENRTEMALSLVENVQSDIEHVLHNRSFEETQQIERELDTLVQRYRKWLKDEMAREQVHETYQQLVDRDISVLSGWGPPPGESMTVDGDFLFPGLQFGNVFMGVQPPRGWQVNEEVLHSNTSIPPTHQYLAFYHYLKQEFEADVLVHVGRHSTYEWLPWKQTGVSGRDYPRITGGALPGVYPYIVDGVGEGLTAKRRGLDVIVSHLTPPIDKSPLYDELLEIRNLIETYEEGQHREEKAMRDRAFERILQRIQEGDLKRELEQYMKQDQGEEANGEEHIESLDPEEWKAEEVDRDHLVHEIGHYLTEIQEQFMPVGLHTFGTEWTEEERNLMVQSMSGDELSDETIRKRLKQSPQRERKNFLSGLSGDFIPPGQGNDPIRTPEVLPTGDNFHSIHGRMIPTRVAYDLGRELAKEARREDPVVEGSRAVVLWASDTVRDHGVMAAFALSLMGIKPKWNSRGRVKGLERLPIEDINMREDVVLNSSGLFRDIYPELLALMDRAVLLALDASSQRIQERFPRLKPALKKTFERYEGERNPGNEPIGTNLVARNWLESVQTFRGRGLSLDQAGLRASYSVFGPGPGSYGASVNRLIERSGAWQNRSELAKTYMRRMGYAYGTGIEGTSSQKTFQQNLQQVESAYLGRASNMYGLLDNNDGYDFLGGLSMAVEELTGEAPANRVVQYANPDQEKVEPLETALNQELRSRYLNPNWIQPLMEEGYSGAREMGGQFAEFLWGWQVTTPHLVDNRVWSDVRDVYLEDAHDLNLDEFLNKDHNVHAKLNMEAVMLVAAKREYWNADEEVIDEIARDFARGVVEHGRPGSGHTQPDHPVMNWIVPRLEGELKQQFQQEIQSGESEGASDEIREDENTSDEPEPDPEQVERITERRQEQTRQEREQNKELERTIPLNRPEIYLLLALFALLLLAGILRGSRSA